jgi:hypothetical protein
MRKHIVRVGLAVAALAAATVGTAGTASARPIPPGESWNFVKWYSGGYGNCQSAGQYSGYEWACYEDDHDFGGGIIRVGFDLYELY